MLQTINLTMTYPTKKLFENINLKLDRNKRYGLIGANGAGKSTFLKILSKELEASSGEIVVENGLKIGILKQDQYAYEDLSLFDAVLSGNARLYEAVKRKNYLYENADLSDESINDELANLEIICAEEDPMYEYDTNITKILEELGFDSSLHNNLMKTITGGDKFKILLAQVLFPKPDILFLDEPTNNLDLKSISWLEDNLKHYEGTMVIISHDRHFLNEVCTHILDLDFCTIREFSGNYDSWYIASNIIAKQQELERNKKLKEKEELEKFIRRFSANASKAKQATSRQKQLEKLNIEQIKVSSRRDPSIVFKAKRDIGNEVLDCENLSKKYADKLIFKNISLKILPGDKIALIGANGVGKSTLCNIITETISPDSGSVKLGATIFKGYFPQNIADEIKGDITLYEWLRGFDKKIDSTEIRNALGRMLFSGEEQEKSLDNLSGGEKHRMYLSKLMLEGGNFLILDEPTNHLDLEAIIALGEALYNFKGNVLCVSHDRELIDAYANRIIELVYSEDGAKMIDFRGSYEEYLDSREV
ncbi:ABC-F family ATP-binding cassette domain-containing protein [Helicobacter sp. MIT 14-3879]|uniref:ABC-F family ATP-binding cassette domain-containing protein n=1 Tax=Helicobacter sp. MIT 14-3879 TaxID=2040649 RepID=UPI000E1E791A|nr:ATP-binding cassette domain-containing protein [Helicobacter sp. MIT 14-3879]RDU65010.1 ABC transporter ATP-binding protein [Helicobacter sp. MIT 14-3879]